MYRAPCPQFSHVRLALSIQAASPVQEYAVDFWATKVLNRSFFSTYSHGATSLDCSIATIQESEGVRTSSGWYRYPARASCRQLLCCALTVTRPALLEGHQYVLMSVSSGCKFCFMIYKLCDNAQYSAHSNSGTGSDVMLFCCSTLRVLQSYAGGAASCFVYS
jgi:hypothetical protein